MFLSRIFCYGDKIHLFKEQSHQIEIREGGSLQGFSAQDLKPTASEAFFGHPSVQYEGKKKQERVVSCSR